MKRIIELCSHKKTLDRIGISMENKHYFAAANTGAGFYSCFDNINDPGREGFLYILKGGPGTGKSTLMKKAGRHFEGLGEAVEYFHCSSDESSLDGVRLPRINTAVIDGTSPHAADPVMPGVTDAIINLGEFIGAEVKEYSREITKLALRKKECFDAAYAYIRAAAALDAAGQTVSASATDLKAVKNAVKEIWRQLGGQEQYRETRHKATGERAFKTARAADFHTPGRERRLFLSAVAGEGKISYRSINKYGRVISLAGNEWAARAVLSELASDLGRKGCGCTSFLDVLAPDRREALEIGPPDTLIAVDAPEAGISVNLEGTLIRGKYGLCRDSLSFGRESIGNILRLAAKALSDAKAAHSEIETYYVRAMDFGGLDRAAEKLIKAMSAYKR